MQRLTPFELREFDGTSGKPVYIAYEGVVYDVTELFTWKLGEHFAHLGGMDLTDKLEDSPHSREEILPMMKRVGVLVEEAQAKSRQ